MNRRPHLGALISLAVLLAACADAPAATPSASASADPASPSPSGAVGETPAEVPSLSVEPSAEPSEEALPAFGCAFPVLGDATVAHAQLADVRVGSHDGYDRIVFEFQNGLPELQISRTTPPLLQDGSGFEMEVEGASFLQILMQGGTKQMPAGGVSYGGPREFSTGFDQLLELEEGGDFEAVSTWYAGLAGEACVRAFTLSDPPRIVIDVEH